MLDVVEITKKYEGQPLLQGVSFTAAQGQILALLGPSGSGKSTLLRIVSGLESADGGKVLWQGSDLSGVPAHLRQFGLMFQEYALFPFLDVADNVAFGLRMQKMPANQIKLRVAECLQLVNLEGFERRRVTDLSGGEQQRVALARTLAPRPHLLMFDEPFGALDRSLKEELLAELRPILRQSQVPVLYVTHDQQEAVALADRLLILHEGRILREGTPQEVWRAPGSAWVARFLDLGTILPARFLPDGRFETAYGTFPLPACGHQHKTGEQVSLLIRPQVEEDGHGKYNIQWNVSEVTFSREGYQVLMEGGLRLKLRTAPIVGQSLMVSLPEEGIQCLD